MPTPNANDPLNLFPARPSDGAPPESRVADEPAVRSGRMMIVERTSSVPPAVTCPFLPSLSAFPSPIRAVVVFVSIAIAIAAATSNGRGGEFFVSAAGVLPRILLYRPLRKLITGVFTVLIAAA